VNWLAARHLAARIGQNSDASRTFGVDEDVLPDIHGVLTNSGSARANIVPKPQSWQYAQRETSQWSNKVELMGSASCEAVAPEGINNRKARLEGVGFSPLPNDAAQMQYRHGASLPRGATPRTIASRLARRELPR